MRFLFIIISAIFLIACTSQKDVIKIADESNNVDSVEYMLIVDEINFDTWMITNSRRIWYHSHEFYRAWNRIYVGEFNSRVLNGAHRPFTELMVAPSTSVHPDVSLSNVPLVTSSGRGLFA